MNWGSRVQHRLRFRKPDELLTVSEHQGNIDHKSNGSQGGQS
jgi:lipopolysaccharide export system permease protein